MILTTWFAKNAKKDQEFFTKEDELMAIKAKNNSKRIIEEIWELKSKNKPLLKLLFDVRDYCMDMFEKDIVITMIYRTDDEQDMIYRDNNRYQKKKFKSPHQFFHALDLRSNTFEKEEIEELVKYLNDKYDDSNFYKFTAMCHNVGHGNHFHIQYYKKGT